MKILLIASLTAAMFFLNAFSQEGNEKVEANIYDIQVKTIKGEDITLDKYKGKAMLIVNVASKCGFTKHYTGLQELYEKYEDQGLVVLGFPCNQFGGQEPGTEDEIMNFCQTNYKVTFPMFSKIKVNGKESHPLYDLLKANGTGDGSGIIKWNFTKFLVSKDGKTILRFGTRTEPKDISKDIEKFLES